MPRQREVFTSTEIPEIQVSSEVDQVRGLARSNDGLEETVNQGAKASRVKEPSIVEDPPSIPEASVSQETPQGGQNQGWKPPLMAPAETEEDPKNFLPKLTKSFKLPRFSGDVKEYRRFINSFNVFVHNRQIPELQKILLLSEALSGRAYQCVKHLDLDEANYEPMRQILEEQFGDESIAEDSHIRALDHILSTGGDIKDDKLPRFVNSISQHILALISLNETYTSLSPSFSNRILDKLPRDTQHKFMSIFRKEYKSTHSCKLEALISFLKEEARIIESLAINRSTGSRLPSTPQSSQQNRNSKFRDQNGRNSSSDRNYQHKKSNSNFMPNESGSFKNRTNNFHVSSLAALADRQVPSEPQRKHKVSCVFCEEDHLSFKCPKILTPQERKDRVIAAKACLKCLKLNHEAKSCKQTFKTGCRFCKGKHYSIICSKAPADMNDRQPRASSVNLKTESSDSALQPVFLWTAHVWAECGDRKKILCRVLLDPGSQSNHITHTMVKKLQSAPETHIDMAMSTAGGHVSNIRNCGVHNITLRSRYDESKFIQLQAIELACLSRAKFPVMKQHFGLSPVADRVPEGETEWVDILLGSEKLARIGFTDPRTFGDVFAFQCIFGWVFGGSINSESVSGPSTMTRFCGFEIVQVATPIRSTSAECALSHEQLSSKELSSASLKKAQTLEDIRFLWLSEDVGFEDESSEHKEEEDELNKALMENFRKTTRRDSTGRYVIRLQLKDNVLSLGDNHNLALSRLYSFLEKLKKDPVKLQAVDMEVEKYLKDGFIEPAKPRQKNQLCHFLPVQAVFKENPGTPLNLKTRLVKDCSARRTNEACLNDVLHQGPNMLPNLIRVMMKFRQYKFCITSDIERAFNQFVIAAEDRTFLRFLWPIGISANPDASIKEFWTTRLDFGLISSPSLHCQGVKLHLENEKLRYPDQTDFIEEISNTFYMDDLCFGADDIKESKRRIKILSKIFQAGHFPLKKWASNSATLGKYIESISPVPETQVTAAQAEAKFVGIPWNQQADTLSISTAKALKKLTTDEPSKRTLLTGVALIYDPLSILAPSTVVAKILLQSLWKASYSWDKPLSEAHRVRFREFTDLLNRARNISIPRHLKSSNGSPIQRQICCFSDASLDAYAACAFLRETFRESETRVFFLMAKARPAPVKPMSIHRLELLGALLAARIVNSLKANLDIEIHSSFLFTDNSSVLGWVNSEPEKWKAFCANRIRRIHALTKKAPWFYCRSKNNPADIASRGLDISDPEIQKLWLNGPSWLSLSTSIPAEQAPLECSAPRTIEAERKQAVSTFLNTSTVPATEEIFFERTFSTWLKAVRFWAFVCRLKSKARAAKLRLANGVRVLPSSNPQLTKLVDTDEMLAARLDLIRLIQKSYFKEEVKSQCKNLKQSSMLFQFNPFVDDEGLIRCRSRLERSTELSYNQKFPIILPPNSNFSKLIIKDIHERRNFHFGGLASTLHILRQDFLVIHARKLTQQVLAACSICRIFHRESASLPVAPLPKFRIERASPFEHSAADFLGPIRYKKDSGEVAKAYVLLFVDAVSRAVHVELTTDLSAAECLGALSKFVNRFPAVRTITSDNGLAFQRAAKELKLIYEHIKDGEIKKWLANSYIKWTFITPTASWMAGSVERLVQAVKRPLRKILGSAIPHFRDLEIILSGIEAMINSRPITTVSAGANEVEALSPANLLYGHRGDTILPQHSLTPLRKGDADKIIFSKRWKYQQRILNAFWKRYQGEYLSYLRGAHKQPNWKVNPLQLGDICLLQDPSHHRGLWPLCRVIAFPENTPASQAKSCTIRTARGQVWNRPIKKLYPIQKSE